MAILVTVQGNIGSGKSTLVERLRERFQGNESVCFLQEPLDIWNTITDEHGTPMLTLYYADQKKYAFSFQMMAYISRLHLLKKAIEDGYTIIISERSLATDKNVFAKMLYDDNKIEEVEYKIYLKWFDEFQKDFPKEHIVYVKTSPEVAHFRVNKRGRAGEDIPLDYLKNCHKYHEDWLATNPMQRLLTINGDVDSNENPDIIGVWNGKVGSFLGIN